MNVQGTFDLLMEKLIFWYEISVKSIPNLVVAVIVLVLFAFMAKTVRKTVKKILPKILNTKSVVDLIGTVAYISILFIGIFTCLEILGLEKTVTSILAGAGVIGLALGFAFQEIASNFVSGILIAVLEPYQVGDIVKVEEFEGEVTHIELRTTCITTYQGLEVFVPNKDMFTKAFINYTSTPKRRVDIEVGVAYSDDLELVEKVTKEALNDLEFRILESPVEVFFHEFGESSINFTARVWVQYSNASIFFRSRHEAIMKIKKAFDQNGITIPFPIRTLDFPQSYLEK